LYHKIKDDAIFIADAHYNTQRVDFDDFLNSIINKDIQTSQIFFMGDMFDFLSYEIDYFKNINTKIIEKIDCISSTIEIVYIEGNHDFNLHKIFPQIKVIKREYQKDINYKLKDTNITISHGDLYMPFVYDIYTKIIRSTFVLKFLNMIDINYFISKKIERSLMQKDICHHFKDFIQFAKNRLIKYNISSKDILIEGHFHQGKSYQNYINISSFAC
jgi:UDP-2,3-diacylglucosamine hydrolase